MHTFLKILSKLPLAALYGLAFIFYILAYHVWRFRRDIVYTNLENSFPEKSTEEISKIATNFYRNYADVILEMIKSISIDSQALDERVNITNPQAITDFLDKGQSVIVMMAHQCNLEWLFLASCVKLSYPMDAVIKPLHNQPMNELMLKSRSRFGGKPIPAKSTITEIIKRKNVVRCFGIAPDQTPRAGDEKFWTQFLNQDTAFFVGVEKIAHLTKYPVFFMGMKRIKKGYYEASLKLIADPPYDKTTPTIIARYAQEVEAQILENPADWLWSHKRWKHKKPIYG